MVSLSWHVVLALIVCQCAMGLIGPSYRKTRVITKVLCDARVLTPAEVVEHGTVVVSDEGQITFVGRTDACPQVDGDRIDMQGWTVVPGFIDDVHVHGGNGISLGVSDTVAEDTSLL